MIIKVMQHFVKSEKAQGTVEAAFMLPIVFLLVLLLVQPGILLYDRMVMQSAAAEGCRLLATSPGFEELSNTDACETYIRRNLGAIPSQDCFHVHNSGCSWNINFEGNEASDVVKVSIETQVRPLPLLDAGASLLGMTNDEGNITLKVEQESKVQPSWITNVPAGTNPRDWVGAWLDDKD